MLFPLLIPTYSHHRDREIVEVDKHVDTVTVRKDLFDKYEKFYKELSNFPNISKYEYDFEAADPETMRWGGKIQFRFTEDDNRKLLKSLEELCQKIVDHNVKSYKYVEEFRSSLGFKAQKLEFKIKYLESKWWYNLFFNKEDFKKKEMDEQFKQYK